MRKQLLKKGMGRFFLVAYSGLVLVFVLVKKR